MEEKFIDEKEIYQAKVFSVHKRIVELENGKRAERDILRHYGGVCAIVFDQDGKLLMVEQYRSGIKALSLELVAGKLEQGEDQDAAIVREVEEELGLKVQEMEYLGKIAVSPAYDEEIIYGYLVKSYIKSNQNLDEDEFLKIHSLELNEILAMIDNGEIIDSKTIAFVLKYVQRKNRS